MILILDTPYLCHRAFHSTGHLRYEDVAVGVLYGVFWDLVVLKDEFDCDRFVFCFDRGCQHRIELSSNYKLSRRSKVYDEDEFLARKELKRQITRLRTELLRQIGYRNLLWQEGYEADDIIASVVVNSLQEGEQAIIVSADQDLWQLLTENISVYNPHRKRLVTAATFREEWGVEPCFWCSIKAFAGCKTDDIEGVRGIGEKTAAKYYAGQLKTGRERFTNNLEVHNRNLKLVKLPFPGVDSFRLQEDRVTYEKWRDVMRSLGMKTLIKESPLLERFGKVRRR